MFQHPYSPRTPPGDDRPGINTNNATIADLQAQVERLHLQLQTLARVLIAKGVLVEEELGEWLKYVDQLDGRMDGKLREGKSPKACPGCRRMNPPRAAKCQYCGNEFPPTFLEGNGE